MDIVPGWADRLLMASAGLTRSAHLKAEMPGHALTLNALGSMFARFSPRELPRVRAWVEGGQRYTITDALVALAQQVDLTLDRRLATATGSTEYCVTFNGLSAWCAQFTEYMQCEMLNPLFNALGGGPVCGADFYAFLGNYGYTPFGVHDDVDHSLLWHLGPGGKTAYVWPRQQYIGLTGGTLSTIEYSALLPQALRYELRPGDLLFVPMGDFHILHSPAFSATLGLTLFPEDPMLECTEGLRLFATDAKRLAAVRDETIALNELVELRRTAVRSNGFVVTPPEMNSLPPTPMDEATLRCSALRTHPSWPLLHRRVGNREALLVRQRAIWSRPSALFSTFCETLNGARRVPFENLRQELASKFQDAAISELVLSVSRFGGLTIEPL